MEFFRHCPGCGRRFHIKLESKTLVDTERASPPTPSVMKLGQTTGSRLDAVPPVFLLQEGKPHILDIEDFRYSYKCHHCGHEWTEKHVKEERER